MDLRKIADAVLVGVWAVVLGMGGLLFWLVLEGACRI